MCDVDASDAVVVHGLGDGGIKAAGGHADEVVAFSEVFCVVWDASEVHGLAVVSADDVDGGGDVLVDVEFVSEDVCGSGGEDGEWGLGSDEASCDLVDGSVAADGDDDVGDGCGFLCESDGVAGSAGAEESTGVAPVMQATGEEFGPVKGGSLSGDRVDDDGHGLGEMQDILLFQRRSRF